MQTEAPGLAGDASGEGEEAPGETAESHAVLQVLYGILDPGLAAAVGLQFQDISIAVGDEGMIAIAGEQRHLGTWRGLDPADDGPHRRGIGPDPERDVGGLDHVGDALNPVGNGPPLRLGDVLDEPA